MSSVTNVIVIADTDEEEGTAALAAYINERMDWRNAGEPFDGTDKRPIGFKVQSPEEWAGCYGGSKHLTRDIILGAFNHLDFNRFRTAIVCAASRFYNVQLFVCGPDDDSFHEVKL